ncbi:uncharacterized protein LOC114958471 [Acropora millepora]|uniref:uncharacterized protein LOC114958471 n=1 Tax=Acropora millepora TaxID=45264 RepID=UPI001CF21386|nr:uncharacterized protein LOC114958471 [Acropora millepora]XP_044173144.1 uncharacterized protein LOC114958471 [Acropora millepora]
MDEKKKEFEKELDRKLASDDFDDIADAVTPKGLGSCSTNTLLKSFEVSGYLRYQAHTDRPDVEELDKLANSVEEFTTCLIDPLKSDTKEREAFGETLDLIIDSAIKHKQEKFLSHPVVFNLLDKTWRGRFVGLKSNFWKWSLLRIYCLLDVFLFPFVFTVLFAIHSVNKWRLKTKELDLCFIMNATGKKAQEDFAKIKECIKVLIRRIGVSSTNYCIISFKKGKAFQHVAFNKKVTYKNDEGRVVFQNDTNHLIRKLDSLNVSRNCTPALHDDFEQALKAFEHDAPRNSSKKVLILLTNDSTGSHGPQKGKLKHFAKKLIDLGVKVVPVGIRDRPVVEDLENIASENRVIRTLLGDHIKLAKRLLKEIYEEDIYDKYLDYFTTPYFIFGRDTLSYLLLLGLHVAICVTPSTVSFSMLEFSILIFFIGRFLSEFKQYTNRAGSTDAPRKHQCRCFPGKRGKYDYEQSPRRGTDETDNADSPIHVEDFRSRKEFSGVGKYFSDRWNVLDFIMLVIYVVTFMLRMITWGVSTTATGNKALVIAGYFYGLNTMILTLRVFGHLMETSKTTGTTHIALISIIEDVAIIFFQFVVGVLAFSLAITKIYVAQASFISREERVARISEGINAECSISGVSCWWEVMVHLVWTLLGITELDPFNTIGHESSSDSLARILYGIFIIGALVLLVNMMIAVLSHTYERVQKNSLRAWSFKRAVTIRTYRDYHPIPVPLNLLSQLLLALCRRKSNKYNDLLDNDSETRAEALDCMIEKLKVIYFAKYGFAFPLSDENKINSMLAETDRNREMCNQIVSRVFPDPSKTDALTHSVGPLAWKSAGIHIEEHMLAYVGPQLCNTCQSISRREFHGARYKTPFSRAVPKFEVIMQEGGMKRELVVGVVGARHEVHRVPGKVRHTVGYHACNGHIVHCDASNTKHIIEGPVVYRGDLIGCRAGFDEAEDDVIPIFFSLNGQPVAQISVKFESGRSQIFPFLGMSHQGIRVLAKMRHSDVQEQEERESLGSSDHDFASIFSETEQNMILYQTFESVEEVKESSDLLQEFVQEKVETITQEVKKQKETFEEQNRKIDEMNRTLNKILNVLKDKGAEEATEPF